MGDHAISRRAGRGWGAQSSRSKRAVVAASETDPSLLWRRVLWIGLAGAWVFFTISALSFSSADPPSVAVVPANDPVANWCGRVGATLAYYGYEMFGLGLWVLIGLWGLHLGVMATGRRVGHLGVRFLGAMIMAASVAAMQGLLLPSTGPVRGLPGGLLGTVGSAELLLRFNALGSFLCLVLMFAVGAVVALDAWAVIAFLWAGNVMVRGAKPVGRVAIAAARTAAGRLGQIGENEPPPARIRINDVDDDEDLPGKNAGSRAGRRKKKDAEEDAGESEAARSESKRRPATKDDAAMVAVAAVKVEEELAADEDEEEKPDAKQAGQSDSAAASPAPAAASSDDGEEDDDEEAPGAPQVFTAEQLREKIAKLPLRFAAANRRSATQEDLQDFQNTAELEGYQFPPLDLLEEPEQNYSERLEAFVREQAEALERALKEYKIDGSVVGIDSGPVITNYEIRLAPGTKVAALQAVSSDLARALKAINIRIVPNTLGRDTVGIEVPNAIKEKVRLKELMTKTRSDGTANPASKMALPMFLGKDASGEPLIADLAQMPHLLIAGTTGSGKSVCMNTIIMSFLYTKKPNELKLVLVDPKMVEMSQFKDIPHLMCPVVTEMSKAAAILEWAVGKMEERYELLAEAGCRDIASYNALSWEELKDAFCPESPEEEARIPRKLPYMVFVIDELADLMMTNKEVEHSIVRIAQKARAVGIHLIIATQRPQANVVTGLIKSNMPARICFKVASGMDSRIVMDQKGGELLLGQGDMLYLSPRSHKVTRSQGTLVDDREIRRVVKFMREVAAPTFERQLVQLRSGGEGLSEAEMRDGLAAAQEDELFDKAVEIVLETRRGSVSMLQRRLAIGYTRAARLVEMMGEAGILGGHKGTVAREVVMTMEEWQALKAQAAADAAEAEEARKNPGKQRELFPVKQSTPEEARAAAGVKPLAETLAGQAGAGKREEVEEAPFEVEDAAAEDEDEDDEEYEEEDGEDEAADEIDEEDEDGDEEDEEEYEEDDEAVDESEDGDGDYEDDEEYEEEEEEDEDEPEPVKRRR